MTEKKGGGELSDAREWLRFGKDTVILLVAVGLALVGKKAMLDGLVKEVRELRAEKS